MADTSNLKINEHGNVKRRNLRESLQWKMNFKSNTRYTRIGNIASRAEYRVDEKFQNLLIFEILIIFQIKKKI